MIVRLDFRRESETLRRAPDTASRSLGGLESSIAEKRPTETSQRALTHTKWEKYARSSPTAILRPSRACPSRARECDFSAPFFAIIVGQGNDIPDAEKGQAGVRAVLPRHGPSEPVGRYVYPARGGLHAHSDARGKRTAQLPPLGAHQRRISGEVTLSFDEKTPDSHCVLQRRRNGA